MIGAFISILNSTLLNIALPSISKDLEIETATVQWLATGYMLVNGIMIPTTAFLIRKYSVRKLFLTAMLLFSIGTIVAGVAHVFPLLLGARMVQAAGSAIMMPLLMNVLLTSFPVEKRGSAMGLFGLVMMAAPAIGPTLSGWIVEHYNWRMLFHFITPLALLVLILGFFKLKDKKEKVDIRIDILSVVLSSLGFGGLLYGFSSAGSKGWDSPWVYGTLAVGTISLILFIVRQLKMETPMLEFRIFTHPMFALSATISIVLNMAMFSAMILMPMYIQTLRGISPFDSGLLMLPGAIIMALMSPITGKLFDKFGARVLAAVGLLITVVTTYYFSELTMETTYGSIMVLYSVRMFGLSMAMMPIMTNGLNSLPARMNPHGTAMNNTLSQVSGAIGTALLVTVMSNRATSSGEDLMTAAMSKLTSKPTAEMMGQMQAQIGMQAMLDGINFAFLVATFIAGLALILTFFIKRAWPAEDNLAKREKQTS
ncbi:DHA2 family efflux MFS transporter permease subunit [Peribacillus sp. NPDC097284]|uniref:DHA2 family efflux MFS transporter permease subunit n=1 Tax=Peribacillus sp. NPDC097284 TaxID=3364401 RepID=UPI0038027B5D